MIVKNGIRMCEYPGCDKRARNKGLYKGKTRYGRYCERHHKSLVAGEFKHEVLSNDKCEICGWDKAPCDRHRTEPHKGYTKKNVRILCPNCHRLVTLGLLTIK